MADSTGTFSLIDASHLLSEFISNDLRTGTFSLIDVPHQLNEFSSDTIFVSGTFSLIDDPHIFSGFLSSDLRTGTFSLIDSTHVIDFEQGDVIDSLKQVPGDATLIQDKVLNSTDLTLSLWDRIYSDGSLIDGTYVGSEYIPRQFNPVFLDYSIWKHSSDGTTPVDYRHRTAANPRVGEFYANMYAPDDPGNYEIRWRYQKTLESYTKEVRETFLVQSWGIDAQP